jgi:malate synthase
VAVPEGTVTEAGIRNNVAVSLRYLESWLGGRGAVAIFNLMEDVATAEIARAQIWQWCRHEVRTEDGRLVTPDLVRRIEAEELTGLTAELTEAGGSPGRAPEAAELFETVAFSDQFVDFLTLPAYEKIE